jgi:hypothetical protein
MNNKLRETFFGFVGQQHIAIFIKNWRSYLHRSILLGNFITGGMVDRVVKFTKQEEKSWL